MTANSAATDTELLRTGGIQARLAPSVHNTQPWRFVLTGDCLEIHCDRRRQLRVLDPTGRQLTISCGCAVFNARVAIAAHGQRAVVDRLPDPAQPDLLARIRVAPDPAATQVLGALDEFVVRRQTNRRRFTDEAPSPDLAGRLTAAAEQEQAMLFEVRSLDHRLAVARLSQQADRLQNADPAYRAELRAWTTDDPVRPDGVPAVAVPHVTGASRDDIPIRDFDTRGSGALPPETRSHLDQALFILGTPADDPLSWLRAGEALERLWLTATEQGYVASLFTQVIEVPYLRDRLRSELSLGMYPHVLLRVGKAPMTSSSMRRGLADVLIDRSGTAG